MEDTTIKNGVKSGRINKIRIDKIEDAFTSARAAIYPETVADYVEAIERGDEFPPIIVFRDGDAKNWRADGNHRIEALKRAGREEIEAKILIGTEEEARLYAASSNISHGRPRSLACGKYWTSVSA